MRQAVCMHIIGGKCFSCSEASSSLLVSSLQSQRCIKSFLTVILMCHACQSPHACWHIWCCSFIPAVGDLLRLFREANRVSFFCDFIVIFLFYLIVFVSAAVLWKLVEVFYERSVRFCGSLRCMMGLRQRSEEMSDSALLTHDLHQI